MIFITTKEPKEKRSQKSAKENKLCFFINEHKRKTYTKEQRPKWLLNFFFARNT